MMLEKVKGLIRDAGLRHPRKWVQPKVSDWKLRYDINQVQRFEDVLRRNGHSLQNFKTILDFGCGSGRLSRQIAKVAPEARLFGCDTIGSDVAACAKRFPNGTFITNNTTPPLAFPDQNFDFIFTYSVFTHLTETNHLAWLRDLSRMLRQGGIMLHTTHSFVCLQRMELFSPWALDKYRLPGGVKAFRPETPYYYAVDNEATPEYGEAVIHPDYIARTWTKTADLELLEHMPAAIESYPEGCQDIILLRKR